MCMGSFVCMYESISCVWYPQKTEEGVRFPGTGDVGVFETPCGCYEPNLGPFQKATYKLM